MIVRLKDGTEFYASKEQADQLWQYKLEGRPWQFGDYKGDAASIYIIKPGGYPPPVREDHRLAAPERARASQSTVDHVREVLAKKGLVKRKIGETA